MVVRFLTVLLLAAAAVRLSASGHVPVPVNAVRLHSAGENLVTVDVTVNSAGPFTFLLDTGANRSAVSQRVAVALQLPTIASTSVVSAGGHRSHRVVRVQQLTLGSVTKERLPVAILDDIELCAVGGGIDGILGQDFLLDQNYTLDYEHRRLVFERSTTAEAPGTALAITATEGRWLATLPPRSAGGGLQFVPDSGASGLVLFDRGAGVSLPTRALDVDGALTTLAGRQSSRAVVIPRLTIGSIVIKNRPALVVERRDPDAPAGDGLLPLSMFASVTFDASRRIMTVRER